MCAIEGNLAENIQGSITGRQAGHHCAYRAVLAISVADLLERILTSPRLTATQLRAMLEAYQLNPERLATALADQPDPAHALSALAHYAVLNGQLTGQGESHVVH